MKAIKNKEKIKKKPRWQETRGSGKKEKELKRLPGLKGKQRGNQEQNGDKILVK